MARELGQGWGGAPTAARRARLTPLRPPAVLAEAVALGSGDKQDQAAGSCPYVWLWRGEPLWSAIPIAIIGLPSADSAKEARSGGASTQSRLHISSFFL